MRRAERARDRQALGAPLAVQLRSVAAGEPIENSARLVLSPHVVGAILGATALALPLAGAPLAAVAAAGPALYLVGYLVARARRRRRALQSMEAELEVAAAFDAFVDAHSPRLPADAADSLQRIKAALARVLPRVQSAHARAALSTEDVFFLTQAVSRYLPDAVEPFLALPPDRIEQQLAGHSKAPHELLIDQLAIVEREFARIEESLFGAEADRLARNRALLERHRSD